MKFKPRNLRAIAEMIIGDNDKFLYRSSSYIAQFFEECDIDHAHDGTTRWSWTVGRLSELLEMPSASINGRSCACSGEYNFFVSQAVMLSGGILQSERCEH